MRNDKLMQELLTRIASSSDDEILEGLDGGFSTVSEATVEAIICFMNILDLREFVTVTERMEGDALVYDIHFDVAGSYTPPSLEGMKYTVTFMCGGATIATQGHNTAADACFDAVLLDCEEPCDYAEVHRVEGDTRTTLLWVNNENESELDVSEDDEDFAVASAAIDQFRNS